MKTIYIILIVIGVILVIITGFYTYYGGFKKITFDIIEQGGETLVYEDVTGDYRQAGEVSDRVYYSLLNEHNIETFKGFGIYYDNPREVERSKLRSKVGCILEETDFDKIPELEKSFNIKTYPHKKYLVTEFPYKDNFSIFTGIMRVYPAIHKYIESNDLKIDGHIMEIYDIPNKKIIYRVEI